LSRLTLGGDTLFSFFRDASTLFFRDIGLGNIYRAHRSNLHSNFVYKRLEIVKASHKVSFAVHLNNYANAVVVYITANNTFTGLTVTFFLGARQTFFAHCLECLVKVPLSLDKRLLGIGQTDTG